MNAREVIAEALSTSYVVRSPSGRADAILAALTEAGYTVARLEQVGWRRSTEDGAWWVDDEELTRWQTAFRDLKSESVFRLLPDPVEDGT